MFVNPQNLHAVEAGWVGEAADGLDLDRGPAGVPVDPEVPGEGGDGGVAHVNASVAHAAARLVTFARGGTRSCRSVNTPAPYGSR